MPGRGSLPQPVSPDAPSEWRPYGPSSPPGWSAPNSLNAGTCGRGFDFDCVRPPKPLTQDGSKDTESVAARPYVALPDEPIAPEAGHLDHPALRPRDAAVDQRLHVD